MPVIIEPEIDLAPVFETVEMQIAAARPKVEPGTGKEFDFTVHEDTMDPITRQVFFFLRHKALSADPPNYSWLPNGRKMKETHIVEIIGPKLAMAAALDVTEEQMEAAREAEKKEQDAAAARRKETLDARAEAQKAFDAAQKASAPTAPVPSAPAPVASSPNAITGDIVTKPGIVESK